MRFLFVNYQTDVFKYRYIYIIYITGVINISNTTFLVELVECRSTFSGYVGLSGFLYD